MLEPSAAGAERPVTENRRKPRGRPSRGRRGSKLSQAGAAHVTTVRPTVVCFGEALWDILPRGIFLGGAPLNVAYHLSRLGLSAVAVSAVGRDFLGDEALRRMRGWNLSTNCIARRRGQPTGTVRARLDSEGTATYEIVQPVAWDHIETPRGLGKIPVPAAVVFGSLAMRTKANRRVAGELLTRWPAAWRVLDLNLRAPFDQGDGVSFALGHAQMVKLNDEELARVTAKPVATERQLRAAAQHFAKTHRLARVCVTAGARGAGLLWSGEWFWERGRPVSVRDTVGAGDAFLAAFLSAHIKRGDTPPSALQAACRHGEFLAARDGATPPYFCDARGRPRDMPPSSSS